jgi:hypothetical protein
MPMREGDIQTIKITKNSQGAFIKVIEYEWLRYVGFTEKELEQDSLELVMKAEVSEHKKIPYVGMGKPIKK